MKNIKVLKGRTEDILQKMSVVGEENINATGQESSATDYNFDILRQHYAGTDFESESNSICDILQSFGTKNKGSTELKPVIVKIRSSIAGVPGFEPYEDFISKLMSIMEEEVINKVSSDPMVPNLNEESRNLPNVKSAQAKLIELEQYLQGMNLSARQKWQDYLSEARQKAAVGDDQFNSTPELGQDDIEYINESTRQKTQRDSVKNSILQGLVGGQ